tara:strand:+ start:120 stop:365 length:246 start_codon:yes stop_codon:yes gene_type:complete
MTGAEGTAGIGGGVVAQAESPAIAPKATKLRLVNMNLPFHSERGRHAVPEGRFRNREADQKAAHIGILHGANSNGKPLQHG